MTGILAAARGAVAGQTRAGARRLLEERGPEPDGSLQIGYLRYLERRRPSWAGEQAIFDDLNQLLVIVGLGRYVAFCFSDRARASSVLKAASGAVVGLDPVPSGVINAAFGRGAPRTLWLDGIHGQTTTKADSKTLVGRDLRDALDPPKIRATTSTRRVA